MKFPNSKEGSIEGRGGMEKLYYSVQAFPSTADICNRATLSSSHANFIYHHPTNMLLRIIILPHNYNVTETEHQQQQRKTKDDEENLVWVNNLYK